MKILKKVLNFIFNPLNILAPENINNKTTDVFLKNTILIFIVSLLITAAVIYLGYFVLKI